MILITGRGGRSGSWLIRGQQLGEALGAVVQPMAGQSDAAIVIGVKRLPDAIVQRFIGRLVWDIVDAFPQPHGNRWSEVDARVWLQREVHRIRPVGIITATAKMAEDCSVFGVPVLWLPHHYRPNIEINPIRERMEVVGYEGGEQYLERWRPAINRACARIGARFVVNPAKLADVDVVLALRSDTGYPARHWKSNVKLANAHGSGTPWIGCRESGYVETACGAERWADDENELNVALDSLTWSERAIARERFLEARLSVQQAANQLKSWIHEII